MHWMDIEIKLRERVLEICQHLLPNGKREGNEWVCGRIDGKPGRSLKVCLAKPGVWKDFADGRGGKNLMGMWCEARNIQFKVAIVEAKNFLGIPDDFDKRVKNATAYVDRRPEVVMWEEVARTWAKCEPITQSGPVWNFLVGQRKIAPAALEWFDVRQVVSKGQWVIVYPYFAPADENERTAILGTGTAPDWLKFEALERIDGKKREWTSKGPEKSLWGMHLAMRAEFRNARSVLICEGEKDALTWLTYGCEEWGVVPVSVPFGAKWKGMQKTQPSPNREWIDRCWDFLEGFETIYVGMDADDAGRRAAADIITEIGPRRCRLVEMPLAPVGERRA
ncbi:MAG: hypothetical protein C5B50_00920 [Verrucomicrobia bacterium]|nr:MAG: hypothetical protein C5B50_00920 [Verrucomicrobiota bacterium]